MKTKKDTKDFFEMLGEIWRDITAIEFLMRAAVAQKNGEVIKFPTPPYTKGKVYEDFPRSFAHKYFSEITKEFNNNFPQLAIPEELISLRNAMAHGLIMEVNNRGQKSL